MNMRVTLSVDAMGGDNAPDMVVEGIGIALNHLSEVNFLLFGDENILVPLVSKNPIIKDACVVKHTPEVISNHEKAGAALRSGRNSSMRLAINAVSNGEAAGIVSAGNTGALMAMAKFVLKTLPGIDRPAIASYFPTERGQSLMLDLGANVICSSDNLVQFAVMGEVFARNVLGLPQPSVGILNVGSEQLKGHESVQLAFYALQNIDLPIKFHGFIEGDDIGKGTVDVIVTDGFTGNIALKTAEGTAKMFSTFLKECLLSTFTSKIGASLAKPALSKFRQRLDPRRYNGAMFLGLNGICVKSHGGTDGLGFANAIDVAVELIRDGLNDVIKEDLAHLEDEPDNSIERHNE
ncbi:MAG: phosphate acyltransferase [Magnetovibrio sp.]|nr:phosphate acyltransferase [Magnetovibrio sp.]|tara:strand:- start:2116 stop:3165 length:1050 start_codon:yes stop_codon:yes gene_type:complete